MLCRVMSIRPKLTCVNVFDVTKNTVVILRSIFPPSGNSKVIPATISTSRVSYHHLIMAITKQLEFRHQAIWGVYASYLRIYNGRMNFSYIRSVRVEYGCFCDPFLKER